MKKSIFIGLVIALATLSCGQKDDCQRCTGTVTSVGTEEFADWTVCDNDGSVIRTNNITGDSETTTNTLPEAVAFFKSIGLECE